MSSAPTQAATQAAPSSGITLAFPQKDTGSAALAAQIPVQPVAPAAEYLETASASASSRNTLSCKDLLSGDTLVAAKAEAAKLLPQMLENTQVMSVYGNDTMDSVNRLIDMLLDKDPPENTEEVRKLMKELSRNMRGMGKKHDPSNPEVIAKYEKARAKWRRWLSFGKGFLAEFLDDMRDLDAQFDRVEKVLTGKQLALLKNVAFYDEYYKLNEQEIAKLIYTIGVMELIRDLAAQQAEAIVVGNAELGDRRGEEKAQLTEFVGLMETRITAFKGRLWVAWAMSPQVRTMRALNVGLAQKLNETVCIGIPTMKSTVVLWLKMSEAEQAKQLNEAVEEAINQSMQQFAAAAAITVPAIAEAIQTPSLSPASVVAMANSIATQADGIVAAIEEGTQKRADLDAAMLTGKDVIDSATNRVNDALLDQVLDIARRAPEIVTSVDDPAVPPVQG